MWETKAPEDTREKTGNMSGIRMWEKKNQSGDAVGRAVEKVWKGAEIAVL